ncbi:fimbrial chaperone protein [Pacificimonas flava]|uniref:fimbrial biogenesis chaperone n=1 Tax=Pacificimonas flava TaxID=1234595 RepID=UPI000571B2AD|nr:molecular chaperone [Pacificimonas flava]MBB5281194.1 fimbrial chaperone protein [Pacificimonas flava]
MFKSLLHVLATGSACLPGAALAGAVVIWPVDPVITADQNASALWLENKGQDPITLQVRALRWLQSGGEEVHEQQNDIAVSPPIAVVEPGDRQLVRVVRRGTVDRSAPQKSFRLLIDELPAPATEDGDAAEPRAQIAVQMRYSLPLFVYGASLDAAKPELTSRIEMANGKTYLVIKNNGAGHARLLDLRTARAGANTMLIPGLVGYVLGGASMRWELPLEEPTTRPFIVNLNGHDVTLATSA